jgi:mannose-6-phosphate isomerase-like protein (cupin superfamily)
MKISSNVLAVSETSVRGCSKESGSVSFVNKPKLMQSINLNEKYEKFTEWWHPYIVGELNENYIKLAKINGEFVWHKHDHEDELFVILSGTLIMDFRDKTVETKSGEILIVPKGVEHRPRTNGEEVRIMLIEPKSTLHTGDVKSELTVENLEWI